MPTNLRSYFLSPEAIIDCVGKGELEVPQPAKLLSSSYCTSYASHMMAFDAVREVRGLPNPPGPAAAAVTAARDAAFGEAGIGEDHVLLRGYGSSGTRPILRSTLALMARADLVTQFALASAIAGTVAARCERAKVRWDYATDPKACWDVYYDPKTGKRRRGPMTFAAARLISQCGAGDTLPECASGGFVAGLEEVQALAWEPYPACYLLEGVKDAIIGKQASKLHLLAVPGQEVID